MITFLTLVSILICINVGMILTSLYSVKKSKDSSKQNITESSTSNIHPLNVLTTDYKKAV